jgi:UDP-N-acetylmuramyl pentapeptide synthase
MGMNHPGEIAYLAGIARPGVAVVTNAQRAHLAGMGRWKRSPAKRAASTGLDEDGVAVFNADDPWADLWRARAAGWGDDFRLRTGGRRQRQGSPAWARKPPQRVRGGGPV